MIGIDIGLHVCGGHCMNELNTNTLRTLLTFNTGHVCNINKIFVRNLQLWVKIYGLFT